jgi:hemerythrin-like domain-containing protein
MPSTVELIDQLITEHKLFSERTADATRPGQSGGLAKLEGLLDDISPWLNQHFDREETILLKAVKERGTGEMVNRFNALLLEHTDLRTRVAQTKEQIEALKSGALARHRWEAGANDIRDHLAHTRTLLEAHASMENTLFAEMRKLFVE